MKSPVRNIRAVLFDWDGTLVNSLDVKIRNAGKLFKQVFDLSSQDVQQTYRRYSGIPRRQLFDAILADLGRPALGDEDYNTLSDRFSTLNTEALSDPSLPGLIPHATSLVLQSLQEIGCLLFISSSAATEELQDIASSLGLEKFITGSGGEIMGSRAGFNKGVHHVDHVCGKYGLTRQELLFVGDDLADIRLGAEAGVLTIAKAGTYPVDVLFANNADLVVKTLEDITRIPGLVFSAAPGQGNGISI
ncbi:HAD family hydrolase [Chloroflexota bacterium]